MDNSPTHAKGTLYTPPVILLVIANVLLAIVLATLLITRPDSGGNQTVGGPSPSTPATSAPTQLPASPQESPGETPTATEPGESAEGEPAEGDPAEDEIEPGDDPAESASTSSSPAAPEEITEVDFALPSGNIWCTLTDQALCTIAAVTDASQWRDCALAGYQVRLLADGEPAIACPSEALPAAAPDVFDVVQYGGSISNEHFNCAVSEQGVVCRSEESGQGFSLRRAGMAIQD